MRYVLLAVTVLAAYVVLAAVVLRIRDRVRERRAVPPPPELRPGTREYSERLTVPHFGDLEAALGRRVPRSFKELYSDALLIGRVDVVLVPPGAGRLEDTWPLSHFIPADRLSLEEQWEELLPHGVGFATDPSGDLYYVPTGKEEEADAPVLLFHHDGGDRTSVAASLREFAGWEVLTEPEAERLFGA